MFADCSTVVKLFEVSKDDWTWVVLITNCHNICDVLLVDGVIEVVRKYLLQVTGFDEDSLETVKDTEGWKRFLLLASSLVPPKVDDLLKEIVVEARALVVVTVRAQQLLLSFTLGAAVESKVVDDVLEVTTSDVLFTFGEILEWVGKVAPLVFRKLVLEFKWSIGYTGNVHAQTIVHSTDLIVHHF